MDETGTWRNDAIRLGVRSGRALAEEHLLPALPTDPLTAQFAWLVVLEALPTIYCMIANLAPAQPKREVPLGMFHALDPLRTIIKKHAQATFEDVPKGARAAILEPPMQLHHGISSFAIAVERKAREFPEPLPYWIGCAIGALGSQFERLGLPSCHIHVTEDLEEAQAALADLAAGKDIEDLIDPPSTIH